MPNHSIEKVFLEIKAPDRSVASVLQQQAGEAFTEALGEELSRQFDQLCPPGQHLVIERITLEVPLPGTDLQEWAAKVATALHRQVALEIDRKHLGGNENLSITTTGATWLQHWRFYWRHGSPPWSAPASLFSSRATLEQVAAARKEVRQENSGLRQLLSRPAVFARCHNSLEPVAWQHLLELLLPRLPKAGALFAWVEGLWQHLPATVQAALPRQQWLFRHWQTAVAEINTGQPPERFFIRLLRNIAPHWPATEKQAPEEMLQRQADGLPAELQPVFRQVCGTWQRRTPPSTQVEKITGGKREEADKLPELSESTPAKAGEKPEGEQRKPATGKETPTLLALDAGVVLLHPFLQMLFMEAKVWVPGAERLQEPRLAMALMHCLVFGKGPVQEQRLAASRYLCGPGPDGPVADAPLPEALRNECETLLGSVVRHWKILKNTSTGGLRESFLQRPGRLEVGAEESVLIVEKAAYDLLLAHLPWPYSLVKLPWMSQALHVRWYER